MLTNGTFFLPGPTEVRPEILAELARPMLPHRGAAFEAVYARCDAGLRHIFRTTRPVYIATASATGLMEGAIRCAPQGVVLSLVNGAFSERFAQVAASCGRTVVRDDVTLGLHHTPERVAELLAQTGARVVTLTHSETSTGAMNDIEAIARTVHAHGAVILVDSVTAWLVHRSRPMRGRWISRSPVHRKPSRCRRGSHSAWRVNDSSPLRRRTRIAGRTSTWSSSRSTP